MKTAIATVITLAAIFGNAANVWEWDFTKGMPEGGKIRYGARRSAEGLYPVCATNLRAKAGFELNAPFVFPEAFRMEMDLVLGNPKRAADEKKWRRSFVWDEIGSLGDDTERTDGVSFAFQRFDGGWNPLMILGFGDGTEALHAKTISVPDGTPMKIAFEYRANGAVFWEINGERTEVFIEHHGKIKSSSQRAVLGDRVCPNQYPLDGMLKKIRIVELEREQFNIAFASRAAFMRGEQGAKAIIEAENFTGGEVKDPSMRVKWLDNGKEVLAKRMADENGIYRWELPVDTRIKPRWREIEVTVEGTTANGKKAQTTKKMRVGIGPRVGERMNVSMSNSNRNVQECAEAGFTIAGIGDFGGFEIREGYDNRNPSIHSFRQLLDEALMCGVGMTFSGKLGRAKRKGVTAEDLSELAKHWEGYGRAFSEYPALKYCVTYSEMRDHSMPTKEQYAARYKAATGCEMPDCVVSNRVLSWRYMFGKKGMYADGIVPEDEEALRFYRWYWSGGDGWPVAFGKVSDAVKRGMGRQDFRTMWEPCVRCPPRWGSGGTCDWLSQWIYADPEPMAVAGGAEEVLAMTKGRPGQEANIHSQLMCYRRRIAPEGVEVENPPAWLKEFGNAKFLAVPADVALEASWSMLAKPMKRGYGFYPWGSISKGLSKWYPDSDPKLRPMMEHILKDVMWKLGPTLLRLGRDEPDVAVFESFTSVALGAPFAMGWNAPPVTFVERARLDPKVVYEETIERDGLDGVKVLFAPNCKYLTRAMADKLAAFQKRGGILVGDGDLLKALKADITVETVRFAAPPKIDQVEGVEQCQAVNPKVAESMKKTQAAKYAMIANAEKLRTALKGKYEWKGDSSTAEIVTYNRKWRDVDYLFAVNDRRTFGDYVGQWGKLMEKGMPQEGYVTMRDEKSEVKVVYEISRGGKAAFEREGNRVKVPVKFETCDGRIFAFLKQEIGGVKIEAKMERGGRMLVKMLVVDKEGKRVHAALPAEIRVYDAGGAEIDGAGYCCAEDGEAKVEMVLNTDDAMGEYRVVCRDLASGFSAHLTSADFSAAGFSALAGAGR